jgi:hypothetical protein
VCVAISWYLQREHDLYPSSLTTSHQAPNQRWVPVEKKKFWVNNEMLTTRPFFYDKTINWKLLEQYGRIRTLLTIDLPQTEQIYIWKNILWMAIVITNVIEVRRWEHQKHGCPEPYPTKTLLSFENQLNMLESFPTTFSAYFPLWCRLSSQFRASLAITLPAACPQAQFAPHYQP